MDNRPLILGVDGGGSKTVAWLAHALPTATAGLEKHEWKILGRGLSGISNQQVVRAEQATQSLEEAIRQAFAEAHVDVLSVSSVCLALAGCDRTTEIDFIRQWAEQFIASDHLCIVNDAVPLLVAGTPDQWGVALIAGTGSLSWGRNQTGQTARAGGWGYLMGDEGSGFALGQAALRAATQFADGRGPQTTLLATLLTSFNCREPEQLIAAVYGDSEKQTSIAALAPIILQEAAANDAVALKIVAAAARSLTTMVESVARQLQFQQRFPLVLAGSLLTGSPVLQNAVRDQVQKCGLNAEPIQSLETPVLGALQLAQQMHHN